jgi:hypothetical protein
VCVTPGCSGAVRTDGVGRAEGRWSAHTGDTPPPRPSLVVSAGVPVEPLDLVAVALAGALGALVTVLVTGSSPVLVAPVALIVAAVAYAMARGARDEAGNSYAQHPEEHVTTGH